MPTVVIPLYNKGLSIGRTLDSVLAQSVLPKEIIVVDDGSRDKGPEVVRRYSGSGVRLVEQANQGVSAARNTGLDLASSNYVAFLDADDEWLPGHLEKLSELIDLYPQAGLLSTGHAIRREGRLFVPRHCLKKGFSGIVEKFFEVYASGLCLVTASTACVRKNAMQEVGGFPVGIRRGEDVVAWANLALRYSVAHANVATVIYNQEASNRSNRLREQEPPASLKHLASLLQNESLGIEKQQGLKKLFDRIAFFTAAGFCLEGDSLGARKIAGLAWHSGRYGTAAAASLTRLVPRAVLRQARRLRRREVRNGLASRQTT